MNAAAPNQRWVTGFLAVAIVPLVFLLDTIVAVARGWSPGTPLNTLLVAFFASVLAIACVTLLVPAVRQLHERRATRLWAALATFLVLCLIAESAATALLPDAESKVFHRKRPGSYQVHHPPLDTMPGTHDGTRYTVNSRGVRGPELPPRSEAYRILCVGCQTTECLLLDDEETWPHLLMQQLHRQDPAHPVWVGDVGIANYASVHHRRFLETSDLADEVDGVLVLLGVNDFLWYVSDGPGFDPLRQEESRQPLWARSRLLNLVREQVRSFAVKSQLTARDPEAEDLVGLRSLRQAGIPSDRLPDLDAALEEYRGRVRRIVETCRRKGIRVIFMTEPVLWDANLSAQTRRRLFAGWINRDQTGHYLTVEKLREGIDAYHAALREIGRELNVECIDLTGMNGRVEWFYDDCHYTCAGAGELARRAAAWLGEHPVRR